MDVVMRAFAAALLAAPGAVIIWLYARRLMTLRDAPELSPGTPAETWIAVLVMTVAIAAFWLATAILRGRVNRALGAAGFMSLVAVTAVMSLGFVRVPGV